MPASSPVKTEGPVAPWFDRLSRPILFFTIALAVVGAYLAFSIPISVFPSTDFPRIVIGVDNGVTPMDQMLVTITRPIEEAVNSVPGLQNVRSITSRGSAEIDLFLPAIAPAMIDEPIEAVIQPDATSASVEMPPIELGW